MQPTTNEQPSTANEQPSVPSPNVPPPMQGPVASTSQAKGNQVRYVQRHARPASTLNGAMVLADWTAKVQRKPGSKSAERVAPLYTEANKGRTLAELWAEYPACRKDLLWDYQHGHLTLA